MKLVTIALFALLASCGGSSSSLPETLVTIGDIHPDQATAQQEARLWAETIHPVL
jgi:hypothetical protein